MWFSVGIRATDMNRGDMVNILASARLARETVSVLLPEEVCLENRVH